MNYYIYTDGSAWKNPGPAGAAFVILNSKKELIHKANFPAGISTNNRMEILSVILGIRYLKKHYQALNKIKIFSDSKLLVSTMNDGWKKKKNTDLWLILDKERADLDIEFQWVKAHNGDKYNEMCDLLANKAAAKSEKLNINYDLTITRQE